MKLGGNLRWALLALYPCKVASRLVDKSNRVLFSVLKHCKACEPDRVSPNICFIRHIADFGKFNRLLIWFCQAKGSKREQFLKMCHGRGYQCSEFQPNRLCGCLLIRENVILKSVILVVVHVVDVLHTGKTWILNRLSSCFICRKQQPKSKKGLLSDFWSYLWIVSFWPKSMFFCTFSEPTSEKCSLLGKGEEILKRTTKPLLRRLRAIKWVTTRPGRRHWGDL